MSYWIMAAALPAFLVEAILYLGTMFEVPRSWFGGQGTRTMQAALLWVSAVLPYIIFSVAAGTFGRNAFYLLCGLCAVLSFWHAVLSRRLAYDVGFLMVAAAPLLTGVFKRIYVSPGAPRVDILGHLMWIRLGVAALLVLREWNPGAFGLWPRGSEWKIGSIWFLIAILPLAGLAMAIGDIRYAPLHGTWWGMAGRAIGYFFGALWVISLPEELFFRGVIERAVLDAWRSPVMAVIISALLYGGAHLWFHQFPNWRHSLVAGALGVVCGIAYLKSRSVRAPMVTHALAVVTWRMFFV